jgi:hypothetical protein
MTSCCIHNSTVPALQKAIQTDGLAIDEMKLNLPPFNLQVGTSCGSNDLDIISILMKEVMLGE